MSAIVTVDPRHFLHAALDCARRGFRVHPLRPGTKKAILKNWPNLATTDDTDLT
jgi:hypothetical protein